MARIIEAKAIISAEDRASKVIGAIGRKLSELGKSSKVSSSIDAMSRALGNAKSQLKALDTFQGAQSGFAAARTRFRETQAAVEAAARAMAAAEKPTRALQSALTNAQSAVSRASSAYERHKDALVGAKRALEGFGMPVGRIAAQQARLRSVVDSTTAGIVRQHAVEDRRAARHDAVRTLGAGAAVVAASHVREFGKKAVVSAADLDIATRKQRVFTDITEGDQSSILTPQAKKIGQETPFTNIDVVKAQTAAMQGLPSGFSPRTRAEVGAGIIENVRNYATLMEADLEKSAESIRSYLQTTGKDISTGPKAVAASRLAVNQLVKMAKMGGMNADDVAGFTKYAGASGTAAGLSSETLMSLAALARRGGLRGDEAGVFVRAASSKMVSPTRQGLAGLNAAGIDFNRYVSMPKSLDSGRLEGAFRNDLGKSFTPEVTKRLEPILSNPALLGDRGKFTEAVTDAVASLFGKNKKGVMGAKDRQAIGRTAGRFHKVSAQSVDTERLLDDAMKSGMTLPQLNSWLTDKHGGKGAITQQQWDEFKSSREKIRSAGDDPNFAKNKADEVMAGLGGALENLKGSIENFTTRIGESWASTLQPMFDKMGSGLDAMSNLSDGALKAGTALVGLAAATSSIVGALTLAGAVLGLSRLPGAVTKGAGAAGGLSAAEAAMLGLGGGGAARAGILGRVSAAVTAGLPVGVGGAALGFGSLAALAGSGIVLADQQFGHREASGPGSRSFGRALRSDLDSRPSYAGSGGGGNNGPVTAQLSGTASVQGSAQVTVTVKVDGSGLAQTVTSAVAALKGSITAGGGSGPGSTGKSSPDASAGKTGSSE